MNAQTPEIAQKSESLDNSTENQEKSILNWEKRLRNEPEILVRELIFEIRIKHKLKDPQIAERIGHSKSYISYLKNSKTFSKFFPKKEKYQRKIVKKLIELRNSIPNKSNSSLQSEEIKENSKGGANGKDNCEGCC